MSESNPNVWNVSPSPVRSGLKSGTRVLGLGLEFPSLHFRDIAVLNLHIMILSPMRHRRGKLDRPFGTSYSTSVDLISRSRTALIYSNSKITYSDFISYEAP